MIPMWANIDSTQYPCGFKVDSIEFTIVSTWIQDGFNIASIVVSTLTQQRYDNDSTLMQYGCNVGSTWLCSICIQFGPNMDFFMGPSRGRSGPNGEFSMYSIWFQCGFKMCIQHAFNMDSEWIPSPFNIGSIWSQHEQNINPKRIQYEPNIDSPRPKNEFYEYLTWGGRIQCGANVNSIYTHYGVNVGATCIQYGPNMVPINIQLGCNMPPIWPQCDVNHGFNLDQRQVQYGPNLDLKVSIWTQSGFGINLRWCQHGPNMDSLWNQGGFNVASRWIQYASKMN